MPKNPHDLQELLPVNYICSTMAFYAKSNGIWAESKLVHGFQMLFTKFMEMQRHLSSIKNRGKLIFLLFGSKWKGLNACTGFNWGELEFKYSISWEAFSSLFYVFYSFSQEDKWRVFYANLYTDQKGFLGVLSFQTTLMKRWWWEATKIFA